MQERPPTAATPVHAQTETGSRSWILLVAVVGLALATRVLHLVACLQADALHGLYLDSAHYARVAAGIREGVGAGDTPYLLSPLYPYFLALFPGATTDPSLQVALGPRIMQAVGGALTCVLVASIARRLATSRAGWIAGLGAALFGPLVHYDLGVLVAGPLGLFLTAALALALHAEDRSAQGAPSARRAWLGVGALLGLAAALRPTGLVLAVAVALVLAWRASRGNRTRFVDAVALLAGTMVIVLPFGVRNASVGEWVPLSANGGFNFWVGNHAGANGVFDPPPGYDFDQDPVGYELATRELGLSVGYTDASHWWASRAFGDMRADPVGALRLFGKKLALALHPSELPQLGWGFAWYRDRSPVLRFPLNALWVLAFALAAVRFRGTASRSSLALPYTFLLVSLLLLAAFFVTGRFRAPVLPVAFALAGVTIDGIWAGLSESSTRRRTLSMFAGLFIVAALGQSFAARRLPVRTASGIEETQRAHGLAARGEFVEALAAYEEAVRVEPTPPALSGAADTLRVLGRSKEAAERYRQLVALHPENALAWFNLGTLLWEDLRAGDEAVASLSRAVELRPDLADARFNLGAVLLQTGRLTEGIAEIEEALATAPPGAPWRGEAERALALARARGR